MTLTIQITFDPVKVWNESDLNFEQWDEKSQQFAHVDLSADDAPSLTELVTQTLWEEIVNNLESVSVPAVIEDITAALNEGTNAGVTRRVET